jgi:hypothetical protein
LFCFANVFLQHVCPPGAESSWRLDHFGIWLTLQESFKAAAAAATAELADTVEVADMAADDVLAAVQRALKPLGLSL